jgi:hypothetical protein
MGFRRYRGGNYDSFFVLLFSRNVKSWLYKNYQKIGEADGILPFCSKASSKSEFVNSEWMAAMATQKPMIPLFLDKGDIPLLLKEKVSVEFSAKKLEESTAVIYAVVKKQLGEAKGASKIKLERITGRDRLRLILIILPIQLYNRKHNC